MAMKKTLITVSLIFALSMIVLLWWFVSGCRGIFDDSAPRGEIFAYVNENYEKLEAFPYDEFEKIRNSYDDRGRGREAAEAFAMEYLGYDTIIDGLYDYNETIWEFSCGGSGNATNSTYTGFYFSKDDTPFAMGFDQYEFTELSPGVYEWKNEDGSHRTYTEKIRDNWYYYVQDYY